jgi:hypothetical protein
VNHNYRKVIGDGAGDTHKAKIAESAMEGAGVIHIHEAHIAFPPAEHDDSIKFVDFHHSRDSGKIFHAITAASAEVRTGPPTQPVDILRQDDSQGEILFHVSDTFHPIGLISPATNPGKPLRMPNIWTKSNVTMYLKRWKPITRTHLMATVESPSHT